MSISQYIESVHRYVPDPEKTPAENLGQMFDVLVNFVEDNNFELVLQVKSQQPVDPMEMAELMATAEKLVEDNPELQQMVDDLAANM